MPEIASDPRTYFKFQSCQRCFHKPCDRLRFGGVFPDKFFFIHNNYLGIGFFDCPFIAESFDEIERLINGVSFSELLFNFNDVLGTLTPSERLSFRQENFVSDYSDVAGRVQFIKALWENQVISVIRIPGTFSLDTKMRKWLFANEGLSYMLKKPELEKKEKGAAVTDELADAQSKEHLENPRWKQVDPDRDEESPDIARIGDGVTLMASAPGFEDGAIVGFDVYDSSSGAPKVIDTVQGKVDGERAEAQWTVADPDDAGDKLDLQFEAAARGKTSGKASIPTKFVFEILLQIDTDDPQAQDDELILLDENNAEIKKYPVKDMIEVSEDMVRIVIEDIDMDKKYSMIRDYGAEDDGGHDPLFIQLTPKELIGFSEPPEDDDDEADDDGDDGDAGNGEESGDDGETGEDGQDGGAKGADAEEEKPDDGIGDDWSTDDDEDEDADGGNDGNAGEGNDNTNAEAPDRRDSGRETGEDAEQ